MQHGFLNKTMAMEFSCNSVSQASQWSSPGEATCCDPGECPPAVQPSPGGGALAGLC